VRLICRTGPCRRAPGFLLFDLRVVHIVALALRVDAGDAPADLYCARRSLALRQFSSLRCASADFCSDSFAAFA